jgi:hypothetical protein
MALRARLAAPPPEPPQSWPWHSLTWGSVSVGEMTAGDRRMEAETYLSSGFGIRSAIERHRDGWVPFGELARAWAPPRIKQIFVEPEYGVPYLNTSQVFDIRPTPRKWLSLEKTSKAETRIAKEGTILVMASASPGRSTLVTRAHENAFISHHFMRIEPTDDGQAGWVYGFLRSTQGRAMMSGSQYASIIRHIEPHHLLALPIPRVTEDTAAEFNRRTRRVLDLRNEAYRLAEEAEALFAKAVGGIDPGQREEGFVIQASEMLSGRRRLEASYHTPQAAAIASHFQHFDRLHDVTRRVWWMPRFKRYYGEDGIPYLSADELFTINPQESKRILVDPADNHRDYFVDPGWIVMACSGQVYGLNGAAALMTQYHANTFFSHDLIRIVVDDSKIRAGYLLVALTHRTHGRPLLIRVAYGTSIPHLDPGDVADFPVVRLGQAKESSIADLAEASAKARAEADVIERSIGADASALIDRFITAKTSTYPDPALGASKRVADRGDHSKSRQ